MNGRATTIKAMGHRGRLPTYQAKVGTFPSTIVVIDPAGNQGVVVQEAREASRRYLRKHRDFIVNATNVVYTTRKRWIDLAMSYGARTRVVMVDHGLDGAMAGNRSRDRRVPEDVVSDLYFKLDAPTPVECHSLVLDVG